IMSSAQILAVFSLLLIDGHAQVLLQQRPPSVIKKESTTVRMECKVEGIYDFQGAYIHWYRQLPAGAPERLLYVTGVSQVNYDSDSYKNKYLCSKVGNKICTLSVLNVHRDDKGTYYCAYWVSHRGNRLQAALTESRLQLQQHTFIQGPKTTAAFLPPSLSLHEIPTS
uniref:Ig-like domain-containing protein n=1 Tax=Coturnix japonica TaxID=93934 RepID=A0A8C2T2X6_COTJA